MPADGDDGAIIIDDSTNISDGSATITYTGLEPIFDPMIAVVREFIFTGGMEGVTLDDDVGAVAGISAIDSTIAEAVDFANPVGPGATLRIITDSATSGGLAGIDDIHLTGLDPLFNGDLEVSL